MSYRLLGFLTLPFALFVASDLFAQSDEFRSAYLKLAAPTTIERENAIARIVAIPDDISARLRTAWRDAETPERIGLFEAAELRQDAALLVQAAEALTSDDPRVTAAARGYVLSLPLDRLKVDEASLQPASLEAWRAIARHAVRREIAYALIDAVIKPGKFRGQFDDLRRRDNHALDVELLDLIRLDASFAEALNDGAARRVDHGAEADRAWGNPWRKLVAAIGGFRPALELLRGEEPADMGAFPRESVMAACELLADLRTAAARALAPSADGDTLMPVLKDFHRDLREYSHQRPLRGALTVDGLRTELELTLAHFGDRTLIDARIGGLRAQVERLAQVSMPVNMRIGNRPDIAARNEAAHLLLRSGRPQEAEVEWDALIRDGLEARRTARDAAAGAVANFLGSVYYNRACAQSLQLKLTSASRSLEAAVAQGYRDYAWILEDGDLEALRLTPEFVGWFTDLAPPALVDRLHAGRGTVAGGAGIERTERTDGR